MNKYTDEQVEHIARVADEVNAAYSRSLGDHSNAPWDSAPNWQRSSTLAGVRLHLENDETQPEDSHKSWLAQKVSEGWTYGPEKRPDLKQHPCVLPFDQLPGHQQSKDYIFHAIVRALADF